MEEIARGGQGALLRAQHHELGTEAALKLSLDADEDSWQRFQQEAKALARLSHPNLLAPDVPRHWLRLGGAKGNLGDHAGALACFERALELEPDAPWAERYRRKVARIRQLQQR